VALQLFTTVGSYRKYRSFEIDNSITFIHKEFPILWLLLDIEWC